jgi:hypothetical protein
MFRTYLTLEKTPLQESHSSMIKKTGTLLTIYEIKKYKMQFCF